MSATSRQAQTAHLHVANDFSEAFEGVDLKSDWRLQATIYDINLDGIPEVYVALRQWDAEYNGWDHANGLALLVYVFHPPASNQELNRDENWTLAGIGTWEGGADVVTFEGDQIILFAIGPKAGGLVLLKDGHLLSGGPLEINTKGEFVPIK